MTEQLMNIPAELRDLRQWIVWKYEDTREGKPTKIPYSPHSAVMASVSSPETWGTFYEAANSSRNGYDGIGFVFTAQDEYAGIDLDHTQDPTIIKTQQRIFKQFDSYSERSPSGKGLHIIIKANLLSGRRRSSVELYSSGRFFTMTGDTFNNKPIAERQDLAKLLWDEMGKIKTPTGYQGAFEEKETDTEILYRASRALNGHKFADLLNGKWRDHYPSQSEADFAFVDMVAFYTRSRNQIVRLFRQSKLGQRDKAQRSDYIEYMLNRAFDRMLPPIDIEGLANALNEAIARQSQPSVPPPPPASPSPYTLPPGLLGDIAGYIYASAPRPVPEIALAGAIALLAGIAGRAYNVNGMGLNHYLLLLAQTGAGKEAIAGGIDRLIVSIADTVPAVREFVGPGEIASSQALQKRLHHTPCLFSILGEFGLRMQQMSHPRASANELSLKRTLLDLYHKNGAGRVLGDMAYSNKDNNIEATRSPSFTMLGESTQETFLRIVDERIIQDGLLPRFLTIDYQGPRVPLNEHHNEAIIPEHIRTKFGDFVAHCLKLAHGVNGVPVVCNVSLDPHAAQLSREYDKIVDEKINSALNETVRQIWNRAHVKVLRLAALVAVGENPYQPTILPAHIEYAKGIVDRDINGLVARFANGDVGHHASEIKQIGLLKKIIQEYVTRPYAEIRGYDIPESLHTNKVIPFVYMSRRLINITAFKDDRTGATNAIKRSISNLVEYGYLSEIGKTEMLDKFNTAARSFVVTNFSAMKA